MGLAWELKSAVSVIKGENKDSEHQRSRAKHSTNDGRSNIANQMLHYISLAGGAISIILLILLTAERSPRVLIFSNPQLGMIQCQKRHPMWQMGKIVRK